MRSSTTPPVASSQHSVYCALPGSIRPRSLVRQALTKSAAPGPVTRALPRCETSKTPTASRTAACSLSTPPPAYSSGISQPPKAANLAPSATCRSCSGDRSGTGRGHGRNLPRSAVVSVGGTYASGGTRRPDRPPEPPHERPPQPTERRVTSPPSASRRHRPRRTRRRRHRHRRAQPARRRRWRHLLLASGRGEHRRGVRRQADRDAGPARRDRRAGRGDQARHARHDHRAGAWSPSGSAPSRPAPRPPPETLRRGRRRRDPRAGRQRVRSRSRCRCRTTPGRAGRAARGRRGRAARRLPVRRLQDQAAARPPRRRSATVAGARAGRRRRRPRRPR